MLCALCGVHLGWGYEASVAGKTPEAFWGLLTFRITMENYQDPTPCTNDL